jgi:putative oxidoreductase
MSFSSSYAKIANLLAAIGDVFQPVLLLVIRLWWGWSFVLTGWGKLSHLDKTVEFFSSLSIPMPKLNAIMAASTECGGGALILLGLFSRLAAVPLIFTMLVAYATADREALFAIVRDTDKFTGATPFLFLLATLIVFAFGPGRLSLDAVLFKNSRAAR